MPDIINVKQYLLSTYLKLTEYSKLNTRSFNKLFIYDLYYSLES